MSIKHLRFASTSWLARLLVLCYVVVIVYPVVFVILTSLKETKEFYANIWGLPQTIAWSNYGRAWSEGGIGGAFINSAVVVVTSVVCILALGALAGYALARLRIPRAGLILTLLVASTMLPTEAVLIPNYLLASRLGLVGTRTALVLTYVGWSLPITIFIFHRFFLSLPVELIEAARVDGAGELHIFFGVVAPLMLPALATGAIINFVSLWGELLWALVVLSNQAAIRTLPFAIIEFKGQYATDWGPLSAAICIVVLPLVAFFLYAQKYLIRGLTGGAVKG